MVSLIRIFSPHTHTYTHQQDKVTPGHAVTLLEGVGALISYCLAGSGKGMDPEVCACGGIASVNVSCGE